MRWLVGWWQQRQYLRWLNALPVEPDEFIDFSVCDWAPEDLLSCGVCSGHGALLIRVDWETGNQQVEECWHCKGTCLAPEQVPEWAVALG